MGAGCDKLFEASFFAMVGGADEVYEIDIGK